MKFTQLAPQHIKSDTGFEVYTVDRYSIRYAEGPRQITIPCEMTCNPLSVDRESFERWDFDPEDTSLPLQEQERIIANLKAAYEFKKVVVIVATRANPEP